MPEGQLVFPKMSVIDNLKAWRQHQQGRQAAFGRTRQGFELFPRPPDRAPFPWPELCLAVNSRCWRWARSHEQPRILMLDEPSLGLSPLFSQIIFAALKKLHENGLTIFASSRI